MTVTDNNNTSTNVSENEAPPTPPATPPIGNPFRISPSVIAQLQRQLEAYDTTPSSISSIFDNLGAPIQRFDYYRFIQNMKTEQHTNDVHPSPLLDIGQVGNQARPTPPSTAEVLNAVLDIHMQHVNRLRRNTASVEAPPTPPPSFINSRNYTAEVLNRLRNMQMEHLLHSSFHMNDDQENAENDGSLKSTLNVAARNPKE